jgi:glutamate synthase domain-containing protein 2
MRSLRACALLLLASFARAGVVSPVIMLGPRLPLALLATPAGNWNASLDPALMSLGSRMPGTSLSPVLRALESKGLTPDAYLAQPQAARVVAVAEAVRALKVEAMAETEKVLSDEHKADPASPEYAVLAARLGWLAGPANAFAPEDKRAEILAAYERAAVRLAAGKRVELESYLKAARLSLLQPADLAYTPVEAMAAQLANPPSRLMSPGTDRLRAASAKDREIPLPAIPAGPMFRAKVGWLKAKFVAKAVVARAVFRPALNAFRSVMTHAGELYRKYISGQPQGKHDWRWSVIEGLHKEGDFRGSFGHAVYEGQPEVASPVIFPEAHLETLRASKHAVGAIRYSPMIGISGMSFPQLSAQSHLSLIYIHLKLAKEQGARMTYNTGEGGPGFALAILEGDADKAKRELIAWNLANNQFKPGSKAEAEIVMLVDALFAKRNSLFAEFSPEDLSRAQVVAQYGSALNGIRGEDSRVDFDKLRKVAASPFVAMTQYKLKQAAKRGAKVDPKKVDHIVAALREIRRDQPFKSPEIVPDLDSYESVAALVKAARVVTKKPVSLKFGVGDAEDLLAFLKFLKGADALPDHIQLDGRGDDFSPGSGNAPPGANTSLPANEAIIVTDAILKKLGIRDRIFLEATGDVLLPTEAIEKLALGADGVCGARLWMGMGLGCAKVKACANGNCPYGIASKSNSLVGLGLDPEAVGPKGAAAAANWHKTFIQQLAEAGLSDWRDARATLGLGTGSSRVRIKDGVKTVPLDRFYSPEYVADLLRGALTRDEVDRLVFGKK